MQIVDQIAPIPLSFSEPLGSRAEAEEVAHAFIELPFDLEKGLPMRVLVVPYCSGPATDGCTGQLLVLSLHHIAIDGWSYNTLTRRVRAGVRPQPTHSRRTGRPAPRLGRN